MRRGELVPLRGATTSVWHRIRDVRDRGGIPLVGDDRWAAEHWDRIVAAAARSAPHPDLAWAALTSGSSGRPRIVLRSAASWAASYPLVTELLAAGPDSVIALPAPPVSSLTLFSLAHAMAGGPQPALPRGHALVAADYAEATCFHGTPQAFRALLDDGVPPGLRTALIGGSRLDGTLRSRAAALGIRVISYYGAAELSFVAADDGDGLRPLPGVDIRIIDGELWVCSPCVAATYADGPLRTGRGWVTAGDRADVINGRLRLLGRTDDAILTASATVIPEEVEGVLRTVPGVGDAVVVGIDQPDLGAVLAAVIEPDPRWTPSIAALREVVARSLAPAHRPRRWYVGELARTGSGKPRRALIRRQVEAGEMSRL